MDKNIKKIIYVGIALCLMLTGCGGKKIISPDDGEQGLFGENNSGKTDDAIYLSDYILSHQPCILYLNGGKDNSKGENDNTSKESPKFPAKDDTPYGLYYFHDDVVTIYYTKLTWGEISKMTDDEIIAGSEAVESATDTEYKFVVFTDDTGNNFEAESIVVRGEFNGSYFVYGGNTWQSYFKNYMTVGYGTQEIYNATFSGWSGHGSDHEWKDIPSPTIWIRKVDDISLRLDQPDSPNVVVDPPECYNNSKEIKNEFFQ